MMALRRSRPPVPQSETAGIAQRGGGGARRAVEEEIRGMVEALRKVLRHLE